MKTLVGAVPVLLAFGITFVSGEFSIRLRGGSTPLEGQVQILRGQEWGAIGTSQWDIQDADVICRQLGFLIAESATLGDNFSSTHPAPPIHIDAVECTGDEWSLSSCLYTLVSDQGEELTERPRAGVKCAVEDSLRLANGDRSSEGQLQVLLHDGRWASICHDNTSTWTSPAATVSCRELGYQELVLDGVTLDTSVDTVAHSQNCTGSEFNLRSCSEYAVTEGVACPAGMVVHLQCRGIPSHPLLPEVSRVTCSSAALTWQQPANENGSPVTLYTVRYTPAGTASQWVELNTTNTSLAIEGLLPGGEYFVGVAAWNSVGAGAFSDSVVMVTTLPDLPPPEGLRASSVGSSTAFLMWRTSLFCLVQVTSYELHYYPRVDSTTMLTQLVSVVEGAVPTNHTLHGLSPFTEYVVMVRMHGYYRDGMGGVQMVVSNFSNFVTLQTQEDVPSAAPASFSAYLLSTAHLQWGPVPEGQTNGIITHYLIACHYDIGGVTMPLSRNLTGTTFSYDLNENTLALGVEYECNVKAGTKVGVGPVSASANFTTPPDFSLAPDPPRNVAFNILSNMDTTRLYARLNARWAVQDCTGQNCVEILGYIAKCSESRQTEEEVVRELVWTSELQMTGVIANLNLSVKPNTGYFCNVDAFNRNGLNRFKGTIVSVPPAEFAPTQSPTQVFTTDVQSESVMVHWTYDEFPRTGKLRAFQLNFYFPDENDPDRLGTQVPENSLTRLVDGFVPIEQINFDHLATGLIPATTYLLEIAAATVAEGPFVRIRITTARASITDVPTEINTAVNTSAPSPFNNLYKFSWSMVQPFSPTGISMIHTGFIIHCGTNTTSSRTNSSILSHSLITSEVRSRYSAEAFVPVLCDAVSYSCSLAAFNDLGEGPRSMEVEIFLQCNRENNPLADSVLTDPYFSMIFLCLSLLLIIFILSSICLFCIYYRRNNRIDEVKEYSAVNEIYDESYIHMAPSDGSFDPNWSRSCGVNRGMVPPLPLVPRPPHSARTSMEGRDNPEPGYESAGLGGVANNLHEPQSSNVYAEINPRPDPNRARGSVERGQVSRPHSRNNVADRRSIPVTRSLTPNTYVFEDNVATGMTTVSHTPNNAPLDTLSNGNNVEFGDMLHPPASTSNTSLSGNDYVEITANGEVKTLTRKISGRSNKSHFTTDATDGCCGVGEESAMGQGSYNPYDNIPELKTNGEGGGGAWRKSTSSACCHSEFVDFIDNLEGRSGSERSLKSNDPPYVAMSDCGHHMATPTTNGTTARNIEIPEQKE